MAVYEYKVVPAPEKGRKGKGAKGTAGRFALALETLMNELGADGWDYLRADTLPCEERSGLTGSTTVYQNMLVFRRERAGQQSAPVAVSRPEAAPAADAGAEAAPAGAPQAPAPTPPEPAATDSAPDVRSTDSAAAKAAAAALTAYRDSRSGAPKLGPATDHRPDRDPSES